MSDTTRKIEMDVYCVQNSKNYELSYFDIKQSVDELERTRTQLSNSIQALRLFRQSELLLEHTINHHWEAYKKIVNQSTVLSNRYLEQCKSRSRAKIKKAA